MTKLTPSHLAILASACTRDDGIAIRPRDLKPAAAAKAGAKLIELALVREVRAKGDMPAWGETEQGHAYSLKILKAGRTAVLAVTPPSATASTAGEAAGTEQIGSSATGLERQPDCEQGPDQAHVDSGPDGPRRRGDAGRA